MTTRDILYSIESRELGLDKDANLIVKGLIPRGTNGRSTDLHLVLTSAKNADGSAIVATSGGAGNFTVASTAGTSLGLKGESAVSNTKTDTAIIEFPAFIGFAAGGGGITVTINAKYTGAGTVGTTKTVGLTAYSIAKDGTQTAITVTAPTSVALTTAATDYAFQLATTGALVGQRILLIPSTALQETAGTALNAVINSIRVG